MKTWLEHERCQHQWVTIDELHDAPLRVSLRMNMSKKKNHDKSCYKCANRAVSNDLRLYVCILDTFRL